jgi:CubicO group peptidase (beta-lactamase class C family)
VSRPIPSNLSEPGCDQVGISVPGLAIVIVHDGEMVPSQGWGDADIASGTPMTPDTACNWFSMTKPVTATVALQLAEQGLLDLDAPVQDYYEPFALTHPVSR